MDESTFQRELIQLKHRMAHMSSTYQRSAQQLPPPPDSRDRDAFHDQLDDVKIRLYSLQASLSYLTDMGAQRAYAPRLLPIEPASPYFASKTLPLHKNSRLLPPLFWQLFSSLRTDIRGIDARVSSLEQKVSDLEDRIDWSDSQCFTPATSEASTFTAACELDSLAYASDRPREQFVRVPTQYANLGENMTYCDQSAPGNLSSGSRSNHELDITKPSTQNSPEAVGFPALSTIPGPEGIAFRDKEIARLDELVRGVQDRLMQSEFLLIQKETQIQSLNHDQMSLSTRALDLERVSSERENTIQFYCALTEEKDHEIERLQIECQSRDAAVEGWTAKFDAMQESFLRKKTQHCYAERQVQQLQAVLYNAQSSKKEYDDFVARKDIEMRQLRDFYEARESEQEQVIDSNAKLIQSRDTEIERINRQFKVLSDDYRNETREKARFARLLEERDHEIKRLKSSLADALISDWRLNSGNDPTTSNDHSKAPGGNRVLSHRQSFNPRQCTLQANGDGSRIRHEHRPVASRERDSAKHDESGWPVTLDQSPQHQTGMPSRESQERDLRRSQSMKLLQKLALAEESGHQPLAQQMTRRRKLPLNDVASRPPLPAPLSPRKMASAVNFGSRAGGSMGPDGQHPILRYQSMQELPRRRLQAYVEEEEGGDV